MQTSGQMTYDCHGYHQDLPKGKASGSVVVTLAGLVFSIGDQRIKVPYSGCMLELGGAGDRILFIRHRSAQGWTFYSSDRSLLDNPLLVDHPELLQQVQRVRKKRQKHVVAIALALLIFLGTPTFLLFRMDIISKHVAAQVPVSWEESLGESSLKQYTFSHDLLSKKETEALLTPLVTPLLDQLNTSEYEYRFHIAMDSSLNAFALPAGFVVIHTQLILEAESAEELLGVLAHEITHVEEQHGIRNVIGTAGIYTVISAFFGDVSGIFATIAGAAPFLLNQSYSRDFEREADKQGYELLVKANIDPRGLASFFQKMLDKEKEMLDKIEDDDARSAIEQAMRFLSTHPASEERIAYLTELTEASSGYFVNLDNEFYALQQAVKRFVAENDTANSDPNDTNNHPDLTEEETVHEN